MSRRPPLSPRARRALAGAAAVVAVTVALVVTLPQSPQPASPSGTAATSRSGAATSPAGTPMPLATSSPAPRSSASPVLAAPSAAGTPVATKVQELLAGRLADPALGGRVGASVLDLTTGAILYDQQSTTGFAPASTAKVLSAVAVLDLLGPEHRFQTRVVWRPATGELVLVGGGDPLLSRQPDLAATPTPTALPTLATQAVEALTRQQITSVVLRFDDSLFDPARPPSWPAGYVAAGVVAPISALSLDEGRVAPGQLRRVADPGRAAADEFAALLAAGGIAVTGAPARTTATPEDQIVATIRSAPLSDVVERVLEVSDNDGAEALGRHAAIAAGQPATPDGVTAAIRGVLTALGVDVSAAQILDASGLSPAAKVPPAVLTATLRAASQRADPALRAAVSGLPVAAFSGTLADRFDGAAERAGAGWVRAKTGTLTGVSSLAGMTTAADGHTYVFSFLADAVANGDAARDALDRAAAALTGCGCTG